MSGCRTQLNPCVFFDECFPLSGGADPNAGYIFRGISEGFRIVDDDFVDSYSCRNYDSILTGSCREQMDETVKSELEMDKVTIVDFVPRCVHSLGAVKKSDGGLRPITDCKRPLGKSINNYMNTVCSEFTFIKLDDVTNVLQQGCYMSVVDIKAAYRSVNVFPDHRGCQGFLWEIDGVQRHLVDNCLCFGLKCAPYIFSRLSEFVVRAMRRRGYSKVFSYLDDFIVVGDTYEECQTGALALIEFLRDLGFFIAWKKVVTPSAQVTYLGIEIDSVKMQVSLPKVKLDKLKRLVHRFLKIDCCSRKELEVLAGNLAHASMVVRGGRTFSRRVINLLRIVQTDSVKLPDWFKDDLQWWRRLVDTFNGRARIISGCDDDQVTLETDSSLSGFACCWAGDWAAGVWALEFVKPSGIFPSIIGQFPLESLMFLWKSTC